MMDNALHYLAVNRQRGLSAELNAIANNVANMSTPGFRREGSVFAEFVVGAGRESSLSMADLQGRFSDPRAGQVDITGGQFDVAILGDGYFLLDNGGEQVMTRAGNFLRGPEGFMASQTGARLLDEGGAPIVIPPDAGEITISPDGTVSADGTPLARIGLVTAPDSILSRGADTGFLPNGAFTLIETPRLMQGALERSNVDPVAEMTRLIEVTRAYESVQSLIEDEDERIRGMLDRVSGR